MSKPIIVSGIKPTGDLHLGNYLGMLRQAVEIQNSGKYSCLYFIADYHAMTQKFTREDMSSRVFDLAVDLLAAGLDPKKSILFKQSDVPEHANLAWIFNCLISMGELQRMVEYKEKVAEGHVPNVGLFDYPVLMAADILIYKGNFVPAGEDQRQHIELARTVARSFNSQFGQSEQNAEAVFPEVKIHTTKTPRVMSLSDPMKKMSKSQPQGCVFVHDSPEVIRKKVMSAVTDSMSDIANDPATRPGLSNLIMLYSEFSGLPIEKIVANSKGKKYSEFKSELAEVIIKTLKPIQEKRAKLLKNKKAIYKILSDGAKRAQKLASKTMAEVKQKTGLL